MAEVNKVVVTGVPLAKVTEQSDSFNDIPKDKWRYVTIPERDIYDNPFPDILINQYKFERGQKHFVPPDFADEMERILSSYQDYSLHLLQPKKRKAVIAGVNSRGGSVF